jgi:hypothetical protein
MYRRQQKIVMEVLGLVLYQQYAHANTVRRLTGMSDNMHKEVIIE